MVCSRGASLTHRFNQMTSNLVLFQQYTSDLNADQKLQFQSEFTTRQRNNGVGICLALLLGGVGAHKFYLKDSGAGIVYALLGTVGWLLVVPPIIVAVLSIVDACKMQGEVIKFNNALAREIKAELDALK